MFCKAGGSRNEIAKANVAPGGAFWRISMRTVILAACCVALLGGVSAASAQTTGQPGQDSMKTNSPMNAQNKMMKKKKMKKGMMKSGDDMSGMKKDDMGGMKK